MGQERFDQIRILKGDITLFEGDAIVNAANSGLVGGGGVDGAIHRAAGTRLMEACRTIGGCPTGEARITRGYDLKAKYVIHTVGPIYKGSPDDPERLASCYENSFNLARENQIQTIAFPAISCGVYGYPVEDACKIALERSVAALEQNRSLLEVVFVLFSQSNLDVYRSCLGRMK